MKSKHLGKTLGLLAVVAVAIAVMAPFAQARTPAPGYGQFAGCPSPEENPKITGCLTSVVKSGRFKLGNKEVPITNPITLSGGSEPEFANFAYNSKGGLSVVKQKVPGGVIGLTGLTWLAELLGSEALTLYAAAELVGKPQIDIQNISLPLRFHLINGALGNNCYVGSSANPVVLHLTTGKSGKLTGVEPSPGFEPVREIFYEKGGTYVDNTFTAPGASGCVLTLFGFIPISINGLVNSTSGLPAAAGVNETVQNIDSEIAETELVYP